MYYKSTKKGDREIIIVTVTALAFKIASYRSLLEFHLSPSLSYGDSEFKPPQAVQSKGAYLCQIPLIDSQYSEKTESLRFVSS